MFTHSIPVQNLSSPFFQTLLGVLFSSEAIIPKIFEEKLKIRHEVSTFLHIFLGALLVHQAVHPKIFEESYEGRDSSSRHQGAQVQSTQCRV